MERLPSASCCVVLPSVSTPCPCACPERVPCPHDASFPTPTPSAMPTPRPTCRRTAPTPSTTSTTRPPTPSPCPTARKWMLFLALAMIPTDVQSVTFYFGGETNQIESPNFTDLAKRPTSFSQDELKAVYDFCQILPFLQASGKVKNIDKNADEICDKLVGLLRPMFEQKKSGPADEEAERKKKTHAGKRAAPTRTRAARNMAYLWDI